MNAPQRRRMTIALATMVLAAAVVGVFLPLPLELLRNTPFESFLAPKLLLGSIIGVTSLACLISAWWRSNTAPDLSLLAGGALIIWVAAELALLRDPAWHQLLFGAIGVALCALGVRAARIRTRWVIIVTLAEGLGFLVPASAGVLSSVAGLGELAQTAVVVAAGFVEGLALGAGQAWALPFKVDRRRYALLSAAGAGLVWATVMTFRLLAEASSVPLAILIIAGVGVACVGLIAIGSAQWLELRRWVPSSGQWIAWTALAWVAALPLSFLPSPLVDESTPLTSHLLLWGSAGLLMAYVMALVTWQAVRRLMAFAS